MAELGESMKKIKKDKAIKIGLVLVIIALGVSFLGNYIRTHNIKIITIPAENVYVTYDGYGFVCVNEYMLSANMSGELTPVVSEGERVAKNYAVYALQSLDSEGKNVGSLQYFYAPLAGLVSYRIDGYESMEDINAVQDLNLAELYTSLSEKKTESAVTANEPCAKIIDNVGTLRLICVMPHSNYTDNLEETSSIRINFPELGFQATGKINTLLSKQDDVVLDMSISGARDSLYLSRVVKAEFGEYVKQDISLPQAAIIYRDGEVGVYALSKRFVYWKAVELKDIDAEGNVIVGGLTEGDEVVADAQRVKEGMYIRQ